MLASESGAVQVVKLLLKEGANPNRLDSDGKSALATAIKGMNLQVVQALVDAGVSVNHLHDTTNGDGSDTGETPLYRAIVADDLAIVEYLLDKGANPNVSGDALLLPFERACCDEATDIGRALVKSKGFDLQGISANSQLGSAVHCSLLTNNVDIMELLLDSGAPVDVVAQPLGSPLHVVADMSVDIRPEDVRRAFKRLVQKGSKIDEGDFGGRTALSLLLSISPTIDIEYLLDDLGASPDVPDQNNITPLHYAAMASTVENLRKLLEKTSDVTVVDKWGRGVLYRAALSNEVTKFEAVLEKLPQDCVQKQLASAIHPAVARGGAYIVEIILGLSASDLNGPDRNGWTPYEIATVYGHHELQSRLLPKMESQPQPQPMARTGPTDKVKPSKWSVEELTASVQLSEDGTVASICGECPSFPPSPTT